MSSLAGILALALVSVLGLYTQDGEAASSLHPGDLISVDGVPCTAGFVLRDSISNKRFLTTSGHCAMQGDGLVTWDNGVGPQVTSASGATIGRVVLATRGTSDLALIEIAPAAAVSPSVRYFGGPVRHGIGDELVPTQVVHYGQGIVISEHAPARRGLVTYKSANWFYAFDGVVIFGDSGSPVMTASGSALGIVDGNYFGAGTFPFVSTARATRIDYVLPTVDDKLGTSLVMEFAPLNPDATLL